MSKKFAVHYEERRVITREIEAKNAKEAYEKFHELSFEERDYKYFNEATSVSEVKDDNNNQNPGS
jgi:predicted O-methyltransferase YrrM